MSKQTTQEIYIRSINKPELKYKVVDYDPETKRAVLQGEYAKFPITPFTKEQLTRLGYEMVKP